MFTEARSEAAHDSPLSDRADPAAAWLQQPANFRDTAQPESGATTLTAADLDYASPYVDVPAPAVQRSATAASPPADEVHAAADRGTAAQGAALPHAAAIAAAFGPVHGQKVAQIQAHVGGSAGEACDEMGAEAFAAGDHVAFQSAPDLHTAAHEAAHVVQQARGVNLYGGVGEAGDAYEAHADEVADRVVAGDSAADLLGGDAGTGGGGRAVQRRPKPPLRGSPNPAVKMEVRHDEAQEGSGAAMDDGLLLVARQLYDTVPKLQARADEVDIWNGHMDDKKAEIRKAKANGHSTTQLQIELSELEGKRALAIAQVRDTVLAGSLNKAKAAITAVRFDTEKMGVSGDEIMGGANALRSVLGTIRGLAEKLDQGNKRELVELEPALNEIFTKLNVRKTSSSPDPSKLGDVDELTKETLKDHLEAAVAQARYLQMAVDAWAGPGAKASGQFGKLHDSIDGLEIHLEDAIKLMKQVDPAERKKLAPKVAAVIRCVEPVHSKGKTRSNGSSPVGSAVMTVERFPDLLANLKTAMNEK